MALFPGSLREEHQTVAVSSQVPLPMAHCDPWPEPYFLDDGLRKVVPYHFTYKTNCKERWRGKELLNVFATEFRDRPLEYYRDAIETGLVKVNGKQVESVDHVLKNGDVVSHQLHRHEPPVTAQSIGIVHEDDNIIVINKPAGIPVHPAGRYRYNSVVELLRVDRGNGWNPMPCNRLDRLTSGLMFVGKTAKAAEEMHIQLKDRTVRKEYIARVIGKFPDGEIACDQAVMQISHKLGLNRARASGKEARTLFRRLAYYPTCTKALPAEDPSKSVDSSHDSTSPRRRLLGYSIVRCMPLTGRTHQIRVHLQFLGHPIANDPIYCNQLVFGAGLGAGDNTADKDEEIISRLSRMGKDEAADALAYHEEMKKYEKNKAEKMTGELCEICATPLYSDPGAHELSIYLHAKRYESTEGKWAYETELPAWALPPEGMDGPTKVTGELDSHRLAENS